MSPIQTQKQIKERVPLLKPQTQAKGKLSLAEQTAQYLAQRKQNLMERAQIADMEVATEESKREAARIRKETERIEAGKEGDEGGGGGPSGPGDGGGGPKGDDSRIWQVDEEKMRVRAVRQGEPALTFNEASEVIREMRRGQDTQIVILDPQTGKHVPNPQSEFAKNNPQIALMTAKEYDRQLAGGKEPNAMEIFIEQKKQADQLREALGIKEGSTTELAFLDRLEKMGLIVKPGATDPAVLATLTDIKNSLNPANKDDPKYTALEDKLAKLTDQLQKDREDRTKEQIASLEARAKAAEARIEQVAKEKSADSEIGLMKDLVSSGQHGADKVVGLVESLIGQGGPKLPTVASKIKTAVVAKVTGNPVEDPELANIENTILEGRTPPGGR